MKIMYVNASHRISYFRIEDYISHKITINWLVVKSKHDIFWIRADKVNDFYITEVEDGKETT